jgi:hypothetical protein
MTEEEYNLAKEVKDKIENIKMSIDEFVHNYLLDNFLISINIGTRSIERIKSIVTEDLKTQINLLEQKFKEL